MNQQLLNSIPEIQIENNTLKGGFVSLNAYQMRTIVAGSTNGTCDNLKDCIGTNTSVCYDRHSCSSQNTGVCNPVGPFEYENVPV
jgi:hypothetical protein